MTNADALIEHATETVSKALRQDMSAEALIAFSAAVFTLLQGLGTREVMQSKEDPVEVALAFAAAQAFFAPNSNKLPRPRGIGWAILLAAVTVLTMTQLMKATPFLYFQF